MTEQALLDGDLDALLARYFRHLAAGPDDETDFDAWGQVSHAVLSAPPAQAWQLVRTLIGRAPAPLLSRVAVGELENFVAQHASTMVGEIEAEAARDVRFRWALGCIWLQHGQFPVEVLARLVEASGGEIKPLPADDEDGGLPA